MYVRRQTTFFLQTSRVCVISLQNFLSTREKAKITRKLAKSEQTLLHYWAEISSRYQEKSPKQRLTYAMSDESRRDSTWVEIQKTRHSSILIIASLWHLFQPNFSRRVDAITGKRRDKKGKLCHCAGLYSPSTCSIRPIRLLEELFLSLFPRNKNLFHKIQCLLISESFVIKLHLRRTCSR